MEKILVTADLPAHSRVMTRYAGHLARERGALLLFNYPLLSFNRKTSKTSGL